jgi:hypothetical protein
LLSAQLVDLLWPIFLLLGLEHVRIAPGNTRFTPLDFYDDPITHSTLGAAVRARAAMYSKIWPAKAFLKIRKQPSDGKT